MLPKNIKTLQEQARKGFRPISNQIRVVAFNVPQLTQASFLQKYQTLQNGFGTKNNGRMK